MIPLYVGFDSREAAAFHVFAQSVINHASEPVAIVPLALPMLLKVYMEVHQDGSNAFIYSRFLVPHMQGFKGWAIFCDGDMLVRDDIKKLWDLRDDRYAAMVVKHDYQTKHPRKYIGSTMETINQSYPCKNWSSVILWNCGHPSNEFLSPAFVMAARGRELHRFEHLNADQIGALPAEWNHLAEEQEPNPDAKLVHYTLGVPAIRHYANCEHAKPWLETLYQAGSVKE